MRYKDGEEEREGGGRDGRELERGMEGRDTKVRGRGGEGGEGEMGWERVRKWKGSEGEVERVRREG